MAIINSLAIGKSVKSAGNLTYKTVRGRTIASQRITRNISNTASQQSQREHFGSVARSIKLIQQYVDVCYEKSKFGSSRNAFFRTNKNFTFGGLIGELEEGVVGLADAMLSSLTFEPLPQLSIISNGSLPGFLNASYSMIKNYKYGTNTYQQIRVIGGNVSYGEASYTFMFASPVKRADLTVKAFAFANDGLISGTGTFDHEGLFTINNAAIRPAFDATECTMVSGNDDLIESVTIGVDMSLMAGAPIAIAVPVVGGKVPTITGVFAKQSAE